MCFFFKQRFLSLKIDFTPICFSQKSFIVAFQKKLLEVWNFPQNDFNSHMNHFMKYSPPQNTQTWFKMKKLCLFCLHVLIKMRILNSDYLAIIVRRTVICFVDASYQWVFRKEFCLFSHLSQLNCYKMLF